jgi:hypothetical protein
LLLTKENEEQTAWHYASLWDNVKSLQKLWDWGKGTQTAEELIRKLLVAKGNNGQTARYYAYMAGQIRGITKTVGLR